MYGYKLNEIGFELQQTPDPTYVLVYLNKTEQKRFPVRVSLGCHYLGAANPVPELNCQKSQAVACIKRVATQMPTINRPLLRRLKRFCQRFLQKNFSDKKFSSNESFDFEEWLESTTYPKYRKEELREIYDKLGSRSPKKDVKAFVKDESYPSYKAHRGIYSRNDEFKVKVGPFFKKLGDIMFDTKWFIKKIPVKDRPEHLKKIFKDCVNLFCTDFSQFEATFVDILMNAIEMEFYKFMLSENPHGDGLLKLIRALCGINKIGFKRFSFRIKAKRMSGEMNTSVGNGFFNMILTLFLLEVIYGVIDPPSIFEGDDGLAGHQGQLPTAMDYYNLGSMIKIEVPERLEEASFCGMIFDSVACDNVCDPVEALVSFGYTTRDYSLARGYKLKELLRAKSLSMIYTYPGCPILRSLALYGLRMSNEIHLDDQFLIRAYTKNLYRKDKLNGLPTKDVVMNKNVHINTRFLVERKYGITVAIQLEIEKYLDNKNDLSPIDLPILMNFMHSDCIDYYRRYGQIQDKPKYHDEFVYFSCVTANQFKIYTSSVRFSLID